MNLPEIRVPEVLAELPRGATPLVACGIAAVFGLLFYTFLRRRKAAHLKVPAASTNRQAGAVRETVTTAGPLAVLGACGMALSLHGLYGFATVDMKLTWLWALPLMAIFDLAEVTCFVSLYRSARTESKWTRDMRRTRRMAWTLVAASSAMNAAHAPGNWVATLVFALIPPVSAKLIEHELDKQLAANSDDEDGGATPGLVRLLGLSYQRFWANAFAQLGFDPTGKQDSVHLDARIRQAARCLQDLSTELDKQDALGEDASERRRTRATKSVEKAKGKAKLAIDVSGIAGDTSAQLMLAHHIVTRDSVGDLARLGKKNAAEIEQLLEQLAILPSAEAIKAGAGAAKAEKQRQEAEQARDEARA
ncbi:DUF2637 domain-containing protein, partial [Streptomyces chryseus]|uniref:DUF2637 domain-containing protein n=2 Tax=Streptomyces chryseus TaxID=68186 RepID=UPI00167849D6